MTWIDPFKIIGISVRTTNKNNKSTQDIATLWGQFYKNNVFEKIPNQLGSDIYSIYTDYESDYKGEYTTIIGLKVSSLDNIPDGLTGRQFTGDNFKIFTAKGEMPTAVIKTWIAIWEKDTDLQRKYTFDFEVYGAKSQNGDNPEVNIYIATDKKE